MGKDVSIVVTARQRFSHTGKTIESIYQNTRTPFNLIVVNERLTGAQAKAKAIPLVETPYCVFLDNDMLVSPGWLEELVICAEQEGAWAVGPLYLEALEGEPPSKIHMAGGWAQVVGNKLQESQVFCRASLRNLNLVYRMPVGYMEFHCLLARREALGFLDANLLSGPDHIDFCKRIWGAGKTVWMEPRSVVTYVMPNPLAEEDKDFYRWIWDAEEDEKGLKRFFDKWGISDNAEFTKNHTSCAAFHRSLA